MLHKLIFLSFTIFKFIGFGYTTPPPQFVKTVFDNLYAASANSNIGKPILTYDTENPNQIVSYRSGTHKSNSGELIVGFKFIELIRTFGSDSSNALAFVLGHEMGHIILKQSKHIESIGTGYADRELKKSLRVIKDSLYSRVFERQADEFAAFYAHIAGYRTTHIGTKVLDAIYKHFKLPDNLHGYPTLAERKVIAETASKRILVLNNIYDAANIAVVGGKYKLAKRLYDIILNEGFESKDVYNNAGIALTMEAIQLDSNFQTYYFPLFLDTDSKFDDKGVHRAFGDDPIELLTEAREYFDKAYSRKYIPAMINLSIVNLLLGDKEESVYYAQKLKTNQIPQGSTLLGIIAHANEKREEAKDYWLSVETTCPIAKRNLNLFFESTSFINSKRNTKQPLIQDTLDLDLIRPFIDKQFNARESDTLNRVLTTKNLQYLNTYIDDVEYSSYKLRGEHEDPIRLAKIQFLNKRIDTDLLTDIAEKIFVSNRYNLYVVNNKIIKLYPDGSFEVYLIN